MSWVTGYCLVEIAQLDFDLRIATRNRAQIADVGVPTNPDRRALGDPAALRGRQPFIKLRGATAYVGVSIARHLHVSPSMQLRNAQLLRMCCASGFGALAFTARDPPALNRHE